MIALLLIQIKVIKFHVEINEVSKFKNLEVVVDSEFKNWEVGDLRPNSFPPPSVNIGVINSQESLSVGLKK